jgi:sarcosine oxidase subunit delta
MDLLSCPLNGPRNIEEFQYLGPLSGRPDPVALSDANWAQHLFRAKNRPGAMFE